MFASPESLDLGQDLVVSWMNVHSHPADYLTLSCGPTVDKDDYIERINVTASSSSVRFEDLHMLRCVYVVSYYHFLNASFVLLGQVNVPMRMSIDSPQHGHLALNDHIDQMVIMYNSASNRTIPSVKYSRRDPSGSTSVFVRSGTSSTYSASDIPDATVKWIAYGDMGVDSSPAAASTALHVSQDILRGYNSFLLHFGDISYARGRGLQWDKYFYLIQDVATRVYVVTMILLLQMSLMNERYVTIIRPYMVSMGNHEYDYIGGDPGRDPSHPDTPNGFHPIWGNYGVDSLGECGVPTVGHQHSYERSCPVFNGMCVDEGTVHIVAGSAGAELETSGFSPSLGKWSVAHVNAWGYLRAEVSKDKLHVAFVRNDNGNVYDEVTLTPWTTT
ncbi:hypothetical protein DYB30_008486 [Aphanomyces astaci]|uniref:Purple acid phosphatase C-terminal domain-containing protein n=1 Tax=Aphanomyces astaci TaxID=112090 RepID=A0A397C6P8_APHAT|nr:hypothetical protein DYB30_008486 [Aphanomyces astaci]